MKVKAISNCYQRLTHGGPCKYIRAGEVVDWQGTGKLPRCFEEVVAPVKAEDVKVETGVEAVPPSLHASDRNEQIVMATERMDHDDDAQWTSGLLPMMSTVSSILESLGFDPTVTRAELTVARPGFMREEKQQ